MKILVTGGAGFIGSFLSEALLQDGHEVFILDSGPSTKIQNILSNDNLHYIRDSVLNNDILESLIMKVDFIYHIAAIVGVKYYVLDPYEVLNVNINSTQNVLKYAYKYGKKVVFSSTSEVYGKNPKVPFKEDDERILGPTSIDRWCYSTSKAVGEHFCFAYKNRGLQIVIIRYFNVYGPKLDQLDMGRVITIFLGQILRDEPVTVIGDGKQTRCFTYISDAIRATVSAGFSDEAIGGVFNIGTDVETSITELAQKMIDISGSKSNIKYVSEYSKYGESYEDIRRRIPDITRMKTILKVQPKVSLGEGLEKTIDWFRNNLHNEIY